MPSPPQPSMAFSFPCLLILFLAQSCLSSSFSNYNPYHYDTTTPMFTPDGRLLQVEYASLAAMHSSPLLMLDLEEVLVLMAYKRSRKGQDRLVRLSSSGNVVVGMSGVLADSIALLQQVQSASENSFRMYGTKELDWLRVATAIGDACQKHAFGGGIRPYGSQMVVCGFEQDQFHVAMTDPSGAVARLNKQDTKGISLAGGTKTLQDKIRKDVQEKLADAKKDLHTGLLVAARAMLEAQKNCSPSLSDGKSEEDPLEATEDPWLEVMVLSPTHGVHRLTDQQVERLLTLAQANEKP